MTSNYHCPAFWQLERVASARILPLRVCFSICNFTFVFFSPKHFVHFHFFLVSDKMEHKSIVAAAGNNAISANHCVRARLGEDTAEITSVNHLIIPLVYNDYTYTLCTAIYF